MKTIIAIIAAALLTGCVTLASTKQADVFKETTAPGEHYALARCLLDAAEGGGDRSFGSYQYQLLSGPGETEVRAFVPPSLFMGVTYIYVAKFAQDGERVKIEMRTNKLEWEASNGWRLVEACVA